MKTAAVIPAAGTGARMHNILPKQYLPLGGKPIISRTLAAIERIPIIDAIFPVLAPGEFDYFREQISGRGRLQKIAGPAPGGNSRQASVFNGIKEAGEDFHIILIHDAVRPFIDEETVMEIIAQASAHGAAAAAVPVSDTLKKASSGFITGTVPRAGLWAAQTPQAFRREIILSAHEQAERDGFTGTDDASLVERLGGKVKIVEAPPWNIKITTAEDFVIAEGILRELGLS